MYQTQVNPFELTKRKISESSGKIAKLLIAVVALLFFVIILAIIITVIALGNSFYIDPTNPYSLVGAMSSFVILGIFILLLSLALIVILIMVLVQYYKLGKGFSDLSNIDQSLTNAKSASTGIYVYVIAFVLGTFIPKTLGSVISLLGTLALGLGFYFIYQTFEDLRKQGRFSKLSSKKLFISVALTFLGNIMSFGSNVAMMGVGGFFNLIGYIVLILGMKDLERDILLIAPLGQVSAQAPHQASPGAPVGAPVGAPTQTPQSPPAQDVAQVKYCPNCGTKNEIQDKFCINCGAKLD